MDITPLFGGDPAVPVRDHFFFYYGGELRAVRQGRWKLVFRHRTRSYLGVEPGRDGHPGKYAFPTIPQALYDLAATETMPD